MAFLPSEALADFTTTIKNTFISMELSPTHLDPTPRRRSVPPSSRLCHTDDASIGHGKLVIANMPTYSFSNCPTEAYSCSEFSGTRTPESMDEVSPANSQIAPPPSFPPGTMMRRLNSRAASFQPQVATPEPSKDHYKKHIAEVIRLTRVRMKDSEHVASVEVSEDADGWSIMIQPKGNDENNWQSELLMTQAKEALLDAASATRSIYVMGYCNAKPFTARPLGFEATLGAMQSATSACWHVFKKGFCRHGDDCCKQHPGCTVPVRVMVEGVQFKSDTRFANIFKEQVADLALTVTSACGANSYVEQAEAFKDKDNQGWTIELTPKGEKTEEAKDYLLTLAKNAMFSASRNSDFVYIMGYAAKPFFEKSGGFVTMLGDMQDESKVCWDFYSKGCCSRDCACRWEHTECLMPINVVVKEKSYPISLNTLAPR